MSQPELSTRVALTRDIPEANLKLGDTAMYIDHLPMNNEEDGAILEVFNAVGESINIVTVPISAITPLRENQVLAVRFLGNDEA